MKSNCIKIDTSKLLIAMANNCFNVNQLCDKANIRITTYRRIIKGQYSKTETVGKIAKALNVKVEDLLEN